MSEDGNVLDPAAMERLQEWGGEALVGKMIELFLGVAPERMEQIRTSVRDGNLDGAARGAHSLKSSSANLGAERLRALSARMEERAEAGEAGDLSSLLEEMEEAFEKTMEELRALQGGEET